MHRACFFVGAVMVVLAPATVGARQTKPKPVYRQLAATMQCAKPDPAALSATPIRCVYSSGEIAGEAMQHEDDVFGTEMYGGTAESVTSALTAGSDPGAIMRLGRGRAQHNGHGVITLANGDTVKVQFQGATTLKGDRPVRGRGTWQFTGGTGKAKGAKGSGRYAGTFDADGSASWEITGKYAVGGEQ
jgi:hypothetical protein